MKLPCVPASGVLRDVCWAIHILVNVRSRVDKKGQLIAVNCEGLSADHAARVTARGSYFGLYFICHGPLSFFIYIDGEREHLFAQQQAH